MLAVVNQPVARHTREKTNAPAVKPPSPKVHFSSTSSIVTGVSRPLTSEEAWLLYDFETHCRSCPHCQSPYKRWQAGAPLCHHGRHLANLVAETIYMQNDEVFERYSKHRKPMRVEIPYTYTYLREQLHVMEEISILRHAYERESRPKVRIHNDDHRHKDTHRRSDSTEVVIEAGRSDKHRRKERYRQDEPHEQKYHDRRPKDKTYHRKSAADVADMEVNVKDKRYRTQDRRPAWADEDTRARR